jgi:hypothetical protein
MSRRAIEFLEEWLGENAVPPLADAPDSDVRLRTEECLKAAKQEGITQQDIEEEVGDVSAYMGSVVADLMVRSQNAGPSASDKEREHRIRTKAFYIWLDEGCPEGRAEIHWDMATELVAIGENRTLTLKPIQDQGRLSPSGEPIEPISAVENAGEFPTETDQGEEIAYPGRKKTE